MLVDLNRQQTVVRWGQPERTETHVIPTPFDSKRAEEIYKQRRGQSEIDRAMTDGEIAYVRAVWDQMPGSTCFMDAFLRVLHNQCGLQTLCPDDLIRACVLPLDHVGFCDGCVRGNHA